MPFATEPRIDVQYASCKITDARLRLLEFMLALATWCVARVARARGHHSMVWRMRVQIDTTKMADGSLHLALNMQWNGYDEMPRWEYVFQRNSQCMSIEQTFLGGSWIITIKEHVFADQSIPNSTDVTIKKEIRMTATPGDFGERTEVFDGHVWLLSLVLVMVSNNNCMFFGVWSVYPSLLCARCD